MKSHVFVLFICVFKISRWSNTQPELINTRADTFDPSAPPS
ncbi:unnamed protein product, partial [Rotaria sp. Silwood1]